MQSLFIIIHVLAAIGLITLVLLQHGRGADAGAAFGSGASGSIFGARGPTTFLTRLTAILAATFFVTSMSLAYISGQSVERRSIIERVQPVDEDFPAPASAPAPVTDVPLPPGQPAEGGTDSEVPSVPSSAAAEGEAPAGEAAGENEKN